MGDYIHIYKHRRGTAEQWKNSEIIPEEAELVVELDEENYKHKLKLGDGIHTYDELSYLTAGEETVTQTLTRTVSVTLYASAWEEITCETDPNIGYYKQTLDIDGINPNSKVDLQPTADMIAVFQSKNLAFVTETIIENDIPIIVCYSIGSIPSSDYTLQATVTEVEIDGNKIIGNTVSTIPNLDDYATKEYVEELKPLIGTIWSVSPSSVATALSEGRRVVLTEDNNMFGKLVFDNFVHYEADNQVAAYTFANPDHISEEYRYKIYGYISSGQWYTIREVFPTKTSDLYNDVGFITSEELESEIYYYTTMSGAVVDIEADTTENAISNTDEAYVKVFTSCDGIKTVALLKDLLETNQINITKNMNVDLGGKTLSFEHSAAYIQASCEKLKISNGSIFVDISGGVPSAGLFRCTSNCLIMDNVSVNVVGGISSQFIGLFLQNTNGVYNIKNCNIDVKNNLNAAVAIYHYKGILNIENTSIKADTDSAKQTYGLLNSDRANLIDSIIFTDAPDNSVDRNGYSIGILNYKTLYATNTNVSGTHSGLSTTGSAFISGGVYESCSHGGMYIYNNGNGETFVKDAIIRCSDYTGVHDSTLFSNAKLAALYFGDSGEASNGEIAYFDGCTIEAVGANHVMALRDSHGDNINVFNISNSTISEGTNYIRTDGQTVKVNIGEGTNITTNRLYVDANYEYTNKLYRRFGNDTDIKGKDLTAVNSFLESERETLLDKNNIRHELGNDERSIISQKAITEILEQYEEDVDSKISEVTETIKQSDWSQNDSSANDYVENRTHWTDDDGTVHPLDETYIPDTIARTENVNEQYNQLSELKADKTAISTPYTFKGTTTFSALPTANNVVNDTYFCTDKNCKYTWNGTGWYQSSLIETQYVDRLNYIDGELSNFISNISEYDEQLFELDKWINGSLYYDSSTTVWKNMSEWRRYPPFSLEAGTYFVKNIHASFFNLEFTDGTVTNLVKYANWVPFSSNGEAANANGYFVIDQTATVYASTNKWDKTMLSRKRIPDNIGYVEGVYALKLRPDVVNYSLNDIKIENILLGNIETMDPRNCGTFSGYPITFVQTHTGSGNRWWEIGFDASQSKRGFIRVDINISTMSGAAKLYLFGNSTSGSRLIIPVQDIKETGRHIMDIDLNFYVVYHDLVLDNNVRVGIANHTDEFSCIYDKINVYDLSTDLDTDRNLNDNLSDMMIQIQSNTNNINSLKERSSATILVAPNGEKYIIQVGENGAVTSTPKIPKNILYIGNSLLIGWGTFGMAASNSSSDYYYYVNQYLQGLGVNLTTNKLKGTGFEGCTSSAEQTTWYNDTLLPTLNNDIDLVIIQLGDNVNTAEKLAVFEQGAKDLVTFVRTNAPRARVAWVGEWYSSTAKQTYIANACAERGADFIDISDLPKVSGYCANIGDVVTKDDGTTVTIDSSGVASHPSSKGMKAVADRIINALFK